MLIDPTFDATFMLLFYFIHFIIDILSVGAGGGQTRETRSLPHKTHVPVEERDGAQAHKQIVSGTCLCYETKAWCEDREWQDGRGIIARRTGRPCWIDFWTETLLTWGSEPRVLCRKPAPVRENPRTKILGQKWVLCVQGQQETHVFIVP